MAHTLNTLSIERAREIVLDHGHKVSFTDEGVLMGGILYSMKQEDGSFVTGYDWTPVPLNIHALRDWLGY